MNIDTKRCAEKIIILLREMFGEGIEFECSDCARTNETLSGISMKLPGYSVVPAVCYDSIPETLSVETAANIVAKVFQDGLRTLKLDQQYFPPMTRENILNNVVLQVLSRKRNRQLLKTYANFLCMDLAGVFRIPVGPYSKRALNTMLVPNETVKKLGLTAEEMTEAAKRNTADKFGIELVNVRRLAKSYMKDQSWPEEPFESVSMESPGFYTLTTKIRINGAALILIPEVLERIGEKAGMDFYILPSSIHEVLIAKDNGTLTRQYLKNLVYNKNRTEGIITPADILSDNVYHYSRKNKTLEIA